MNRRQLDKLNAKYGSLFVKFGRPRKWGRDFKKNKFIKNFAGIIGSSKGFEIIEDLR